MGKNSVNRTKFQPSSSSQAFGQMQNTGFIGFSSGRIPGAEVSGLSGELQLAFKKASKKDVTTKLKAFTQLQDLFTTKEVSDNIETCLNLWCNLFRGLLIERERRIRETGIRAHGVLMQVAGRKVAPYLKRLIGPWLLFLHDSSRSCRTLAFEALSNSIPEQKHNATWVFCKEEIISFISDRVDQTQQSLCPPSLAKGTEAADIYEENMACCLLATCFLLRTLPNNETYKISDQYQELINNERLWKLASMKSSSVASAFLQFLDEALLKVPNIINQKYEKIVPLFIQSFKGKERQICQFLWKPLVRSFRDHSEQISSVNPKVMRQLKEQMFAFFREGSCGVAQVAYPSLTILVPYLPTSITGENKEKYFEQLLPSIWKGTETKSFNAQDMNQLVSCYVDVLLYALNEFYLGNFLNESANEIPAWSRFLTKPFQEYFTSEIPSNETICTQFVRLFSDVAEEHKETVPALFKMCIDCMEEVFNDSITSEDTEKAKSNLERIALFLCISYESIPRYITLGKPNIIQKLFTKAMQAKETSNGANLLFLSKLTDTIPFDHCILSEERSGYYENVLLPMAKEIIHSNEAHSQQANYTFDLLGNYFPNQPGTQGDLWNSLLLLFQELNELEGLYTFLNKHIRPDGNAKLWRNPILDEIVQNACSETVSCSVDIQFKFLAFVLGGNTMTTEASLVSKETRIIVIERLTKQLEEYLRENVCEEKFCMKRMQRIVFAIKLSCDCLATNILPITGEAAKKIRLQALWTFFGLSVDIKYFWKKISLDLSSFVVSPSDSQFDHFELSSNGFSDEQIQLSPVAMAARYAWDMNQSTLQDHFEMDERIEFIRRLINEIHNEMSSCDITWFRPALHAKQVKLLLTVAEHSASQFVLDLAIQPEENWISSREEIPNINLLIDYFKSDISNFCAPQLESKHENSAGGKFAYSRMICFLLSLMKELGIDVIVGKSDFRRVWTICEVYCGYVLCKDVLLPPVDKSNENDEEWAMVVELLMPMMNKDFSFPPALVSPFNKALIHCMFSRITGDHVSIINSYAAAFLLRKYVNGDHLRSAEFLSLYLPSLTSDILTSEKKQVKFDLQPVLITRIIRKSKSESM